MGQKCVFAKMVKGRLVGPLLDHGYPTSTPSATGTAPKSTQKACFGTQMGQTYAVQHEFCARRRAVGARILSTRAGASTVGRCPICDVCQATAKGSGTLESEYEVW